VYFYYQDVGGQEEWHVAKASTLETMKPTFITVLSTDSIVTKDMPREVKDKIRYAGPMYFDLDSSEVLDSVQGAIDLVNKLTELGLDESDFALYLSGKKGIHLTIPQTVFMDRLAPLQRLPAIYKEVAFQLAVDTLDFAVYTAGMGRMFRTPFNRRENGNYKVRITVAELKSILTQEEYNAIARTARADPPLDAKFRPKLALVFDAARQKVTKFKRLKPKPVSPQLLEKHKPTVEKLLAGQVEPGVGFNKIAIQLALYAREAGWRPNELVQAAQGLIEKHASDSYRYNTSSKRERELLRMCQYVEDNSSYEYAIEPIRALVASGDSNYAEREDTGEADAEDSSGGVVLRDGAYWVSGGDDTPDKCILTAYFANCRVLSNASTGAISCLVTDIIVGGIKRQISVERADFVGSASLHRLTAQFGVSFMGSDIHARGIYELMLRNIEPHVYVTEREGLDVVRIPTSPFEVAREPFVIWADYKGVKIPPKIQELGISFQFQGYPDPSGVIKTDLSNAPPLGAWLKEPGNKDRLTSCLVNLFRCHPADVVSKVLGWHVACFWRQMFHEAYSKFPLLHVNGPAGSGKSELIGSMLHMFYNNQTPAETTPTSSVFAILSLIGGSASVPVFVDEYKPQEMSKEKHNQLKLLFRDAYNRRDTTRGGGNRSKENYGALSVISLSAPICFVAEALESETALLERCVIVTLRRQPTAIATRNYMYFREFQKARDVLSVLGANIAANVTRTATLPGLKAEFDPIYDAARKEHLLQPEDEGKLSADELARKANGKERLVYNNSVAAFGLQQFEKLLVAIYTQEGYDNLFKRHMDIMKERVYSRMEDAVRGTMPEYLKVLVAMSDMSRLPAESLHVLRDGAEFSLTDEGGFQVIHLAARAAYAKYRSWTRNQGVVPLYQSEMSFVHALSDIPQYIRKGTGTKNMKVDTAVLDYDALLRAGVPPFIGKLVKL
jgi:hypothetical protein